MLHEKSYVASLDQVTTGDGDLVFSARDGTPRQLLASSLIAGRRRTRRMRRGTVISKETTKANAVHGVFRPITYLSV